MSRAIELFERLRSGGDQALDQLIADYEPESLFLDFKGSQDKGTSSVLHKDDGKNLSKAISGFGNSAGGVLVWGVDCRRDASGNEVATKAALPNPNLLRSKIESAISRSTLPPHTGVQTIAFPDISDPSKGCVAVLIPQATFGPLRSVVTNHYHLRSGSDFGIVPHDVLAGMFGRGPRPNLDVNFVSQPAVLDQSGTWLKLRLGVVAVNLGSVIADRPFLSIWLNAFPREHFSWAQANSADYIARSGVLPGMSMVAQPGISVPPGATEDLCTVEFSVPVDTPRKIDAQFTAGAQGAMPRRFNVGADLNEVVACIQALQAGKAVNSGDLLLANLPRSP